MKNFGMILLVGLVVLTAAFFFFDFRLMNSQTQWNSGIASSGRESFKTNQPFSPAATGLYVEGKSPVTEPVQDQLKKAIQGQNYAGEITAINLPADRMDLPVLYVEMIPLRHFWTPVYASAEYKLVVSYASNGDVSFRKQEPVHFQANKDQPAVQFQASYTITDTSTGMISSPGYQNYLANQIVSLIQATLQKQLAE